MATQAQKNQIKKLREILAPKVFSGRPPGHLTIWRQVGDLFRLETEDGPTFTQAQMEALQTRPVIVHLNYGTDNFTHL